MALGIVSLETGGKGQNLRVTVPGESAELANLRWSQVGSAPTATGGTILPVPRAQLWQGEVPLGAGREERRIPRVPTERRLRGSKGGRRDPPQAPMKSQLLNGLFPTALFVPMFCPGH